LISLNSTKFKILARLPTLSKSDLIPFNSDHIFNQSIIAFVFVLLILWNLSIAPSIGLQFPRAFRPFVVALRIEQSWGMFAPTVFKEDGWVITEAKSKSGKIYDLTEENGVYSEDKPNYLLDKFKNDRWRKYTEQLLVPSRSYLRDDYKDYLLRRWNSNNSDKVDSVELYYMMEFTKPYGEELSIEKVELKSSFN
jgi:hypothetical protein